MAGRRPRRSAEAGEEELERWGERGSGGEGGWDGRPSSQEVGGRRPRLLRARGGRRRPGGGTAARGGARRGHVLGLVVLCWLPHVIPAVMVGLVFPSLCDGESAPD